ncbi:MAG TPA: ATP-binding protein, partial [Gemmatimonadaceae bacterium]|nr:ATP-binding protein [Gemmatimonadaceae bacterium]
ANAGAMGLGLFLARGVVEQHGGSLHIDSTLGAGTTVRVLLPAASEATASALEPVMGRVGAPRADVSTSPARGVVVGH